MAVTTSALAGYFKRVYDDGLEDAVPQWAELQKRIPFRTQKRLGNSFHFPVRLQQSHGVTWNTDGSAFTLNNPVSMLTQDATVSPTSLVVQEDISYAAISRAIERGPAAFGDSMDEVIVSIREAAQFYLEMTLLYGGGHIGSITANSGTGTVQTVTISAASWASGIWAQMEGASVDLYTAAGTLINAVNDVTVQTVLADTRKLILQGDGTDLAVATTGVVIRPYGATGKWFSGIEKILQNTGTLFGIDASTYGLWKANTATAGSAKATMAKIMGALTKAVGRGLMEDVICLMSPWTWTDVNNDTAALRRFAQSTKSELDIGTNAIAFYGVNGGKVELVSHPMVKAGHCMVFPPKRFARVGSTDTTNRFSHVKGQGENFFIELEGSAGIRLRAFWDQAIIPKCPAKCVELSAIVNESGP